MSKDRITINVGEGAAFLWMGAILSTFVFCILKGFHLVDISWIMIFSPIWLLMGAYLIVFLAVFVFLVAMAFLK
jgi:hypothetical protein